MSQTTFPTSQDAGFAGMLADASVRDVISRINEEATAVLFGLGVQQGTSDVLFKQPTSAAQEIIGCTLHSHAYDNAGETAQSVPADSPADVIKLGRILVTCETAVTDGADAYVRIDDGVLDAAQLTKGGWGADDDSGTRRHVKGAKFRTTAAKGAVAVLELTSSLSQNDALTLSAIIATIAATTTYAIGAAPATRHMAVTSVMLDATVAVGDATDHWTIALMSGATSLATWDTDTAVDGALVAGTPVAMNVTATNVVDPGDPVTLVFTKNASAAAFTVAGMGTAHFDVV